MSRLELILADLQNVRLRVLHGSYAFGEIVQCRPFDIMRAGSVAPRIRIFEVTPAREVA